MAQTIVAADIASDTRWETSGSPYVVNGAIAVRAGATLTIDAGVVVSMGSGAGLTVQAGGVRANGTAALPVHVRSDKVRAGQGASAGDWNQWTFTAGTVNTRLEHVLFEHGRGVVVNGSAPEFNFVDIRSQQGAAIAIDLAASPFGLGNRASGNALNAVSVAAGDIAGNVRWGLRGIPYAVTGGAVSVGATPTVVALSPSTVEVGQTVTVTVSGSRLSGVSEATLDRPGLALTPFSGGSSSQVFMQLKVDAAAAPGRAALRLVVDAGEVVLPDAVTVTLPVPTISGVSPLSVNAQSGPLEVTVVGRNFSAASQVLFNGAAAATRFVSATELRATLLNQQAAATLAVQVRAPDPAIAGQYLLSNQGSLVVQAAVPPVVSIEPAPLALPPDATSRNIVLRLSKADFRDHSIDVSVSDPAKLTVSPATLIIPAGQTVATLAVVPRVAGTVSLTLRSSTLAQVVVPVFITADFRGANTSYSGLVGVVNGEVSVPPVTTEAKVTNAPVGVAVGGTLTGVSPGGWARGTTVRFTVTGKGIPSGAQLSLSPSTGVSVEAMNVAADGSQIQVDVTAASDAVAGARRVVVKDVAGKELVFANALQSTVQLTTGAPTIESVTPLISPRGDRIRLVVRGRNLQQGLLRVTPAAGLGIDTQLEIDADGTSIATWVDIASDAVTGMRLVQVVTPSGMSSAELLSFNTWMLAEADTVRGDVGPFASRLVGVMVGVPAVGEKPVTVTPGSTAVGVLNGAGVLEVLPRVGVVGSDVLVTVRGRSLQSMTGAALVPSTGASLVGAPTANAEGTEATFTLRLAPDAPLGSRKLVLLTAAGVLTTVKWTDDSFLVSAPLPELDSVTPQVLTAGSTGVEMTVRGRNLINITGVRAEPANGMTFNGPFTVSEDGSVLSFFGAVATGAPAADSTLVITTVAGDSTLVPSPRNRVRVSATSGSAHAITTALVGVMVGSVAEPDALIGMLASAPVGVAVGTNSATLPDEPQTGLLGTRPVGVVVGAHVAVVTPGGVLQGASGTITVTGSGFDAVTAVVAAPSTGLLFDTPVVTGGGTVLSVGVSAAPDAPAGPRHLRLQTVSGTVATVSAEPVFGVGAIPILQSVSPILLERGRAATVTVRGTGLSAVTGVSFAPASGVRAVTTPVFLSDALGDYLQFNVLVGADATLGNRVLVLEVPGGQSGTAPLPANTFNVVAPQ
ncbi:IPT/TIG domain-containing protein [Rhizobacter sp. LjRoot28]|uniref:IPT/TIG domain-containing protein n=1 Tax=Rhizobacter sp. LjRoot28 TaxID=3342309 RepID=UPI003ECCC105